MTSYCFKNYDIMYDIIIYDIIYDIVQRKVPDGEDLNLKFAPQACTVAP